MGASVVDTLVYRLEDDDAHVRYETLQKLRKIAAVERSHFPVRNPRRFLHCLRRRLADNAPQNALEALRLVSEIMGILGDDVEQILATILPHLIVNLPCEDRRNGEDEEAEGDIDGRSYQPLVLHEETYQVLRKYAIVSNDLKAVVELLINMGLAHAHVSVREACVLAIMRLLDERYYVHPRNKARSSSKASKSCMDKSLFIALFQALVPILEDPNENVVVAAEEALGKVHLYCGGDATVVDEIMTFLSVEDRRTLRAHQHHIDEFLDACSANVSTATDITSPTRMSGSSSPILETSTMANSTPRPSSSSGRQKLHFGFVSDEIVAPLTTSIASNSNSDWKRRSVAVEKLFVASKQADPTVMHACVRDLDALFEILVRLLQDVDVHIANRALQITHVLFHKLSEFQGDGDASETSQEHWAAAGSYLKKMLPHLVEMGANFAEDEAMEAQVYTVLLRLFQCGYLSVVSTSQTLLNALQHRRFQIREEALKVWILLPLVAQREGFNTSKVLSQSALQVLGRLLGDTSLRVRAMALETAAVLAFSTRSALPKLLEANLDEYQLNQVDLDALRRRLRRPELPALQENGTLCFQQKANNTSSTVSMRTSIATDMSLSGVSELHMVGNASKEFDGGGGTYLRHSQSHIAETESLRRSVAPHGDRLINSVRDNAESFGVNSSISRSPRDSSNGTTSTTNAKAGGSLSDRSYFMDQVHPHAGDQSGGGTATNSVDSIAMADELVMLKKKTSQLRKSASTKRVAATNAYAGESRDGGEQQDARIHSDTSNQQVVRSHTSPQHYTEHSTAERSTDWKSHRKEDVAVVRSSKSSFVGFQQRVPTPEDPGQPSPQKLQMLQSSSHDSSAEAREDAVRQTSPTYSRDDRPVRSQVAKPQPVDEYPDEYYTSPTFNGNNDVEAPMPRKVVAPSLATRKRLETKQRQLEKEAVKDKEIQGNGTPWIQEGAFGDAETPAPAASRPISLTTRKRLEAKAKQELTAAAANRVVDDNYDDEKTGLTRKFSFVSKAVKSGIADDKSSRPSAFGNKEPRYLEPHEVKPLANPKQDAGKLLSQLRSDDWKMNFEALNIVRRLAMYHPAFLEDKIHAVTKEILAQVPNLRSTVSKNSLLALDSMCSTFQRAMDPEIDSILSVLIKRCTDSNAFIRERDGDAFEQQGCTNSARSGTLDAYFDREYGRPNPNQQGFDHGLRHLGKCLEDSNNEVRGAAKQSILYLCCEQRIDAEKLKKMVPQSAKAKVDQVLSGKANYSPAIPTSAGSKVGAAAAALPSASSHTQVAKVSAAATVTVSSGVTTTANAVARKPPAAAITIDMAVLEALQKKLESSNWKERYDALADTTSFACTHAKALSESGKIIGLFDGITKRMEDGNSKVNVYVLECLEKMIPALGNGMELVLSSFVPVLTKNLAANSPKLTALAQSVIQALCTHVEAKLLCQHFTSLARHANSRVKPLLIDILDQLAAQNDDKNQFAPNRYVLPLALKLLKEAKSDVKDANVRLLRSLYANLGATMLQSVYRQSTAQQEKITSILGISNFAKQ